MMDQHFSDLIKHCENSGYGNPEKKNLQNGTVLVAVPDVKVDGWNRPKVKILFLAPPGYPAAQPDCFWVEPGELRYDNGGTPQGSSDSNPIPNDTEASRSTTWFSWHVSTWNPNRDSLVTYLAVILDRLKRQE